MLRCPHCGEDRLVEFDPVLGVGVCDVCGKSWRPADVALLTMSAIRKSLAMASERGRVSETTEVLKHDRRL